MYLMFDHSGVLEGVCINDLSMIKENDLFLQEYQFGYQVLKNGVHIVAVINELVEQHGYQVVFHSKSRAEAQVTTLFHLQAACKSKKITFPTVYAMAVFDPLRYPTKMSSDPEVSVTQGILTTCWGVNDHEGKVSVRRALEKLLNIQVGDRKKHIVFSNVPVPREEEYESFLIGNRKEKGTVPLVQALYEVLGNARAARLTKQQNHATLGFFNQGVDLSDEFEHYLSEATQKIRIAMGTISTADYWLTLSPRKQQNLREIFARENVHDQLFVDL